jgi:peptidoglycan/xylan/chitin deacetylase (PgdA/CDA1 family)
MAVVLMYHQIGEVSTTELRYSVSTESFREQLGHLAASGYEVVGIGQALARPEAGRRRVVITFDDGSASDYRVAAPLLAQHGFGATFYVVPGRLGDDGYMTEAEVVALAESGFEIGSHSMTHPYLNDLAAAALETEVAGSKRRLEALLGRPVRHFACPGGRVNGGVRTAVRAAGYESMATSRTGAAPFGTDPFGLPRIAVLRHTTLTQFARLCRAEGLLFRRLPEAARGVARRILGNGSYDRLRHALLNER